MGRVMGIDYGSKKTGIAVTDPMRIISTGLSTVATQEVLEFIDEYVSREAVDVFVVGMPLTEDGKPAQIAHLVVGFIRKLQSKYPEKKVVEWDERYSSKEAKQYIIKSGIGKKKRRDKTLVDKIAAAIILQDYMQQNFW